MGDATGIGPEIIVKALSSRELYRECRPLVLGDSDVLMRASEIAGQPEVCIRRIAAAPDARFRFRSLDVLELDGPTLTDLRMGVVNAEAGRAAARYVELAVQLALDGSIHAIATAPINKEAMNLAGYAYAGHTEMLAHLTDTHDYAMMLVSHSLRVVHVTTHLALREACTKVSKENVLKTLVLTHRSLCAMGMRHPRIAVAALNPHAGEGGLFGNEERDDIAPAVAEAQASGVNAVGPLPSDTVFLRGRNGEFDIVVAMYHDQGHIPIKLLGFEEGVNVTLGLPLTRTSVDHGTAFDIAGKGIANPRSMIEAIKLAALLTTRPSE
jgi:4-hydroxythreonine-4-phosphate dehydrogenase